MKNPYLLRTAALVAALGMGGVLAQSAPVATDAGPPPPEDRASTGAIVLDKSLERAQRDNAFERSAARSGVATVGRGVLRATMRAQTEADLAQARQNEVRELRGRGAGSLTEK